MEDKVEFELTYLKIGFLGKLGEGKVQKLMEFERFCRRLTRISSQFSETFISPLLSEL